MEAENETCGVCSSHYDNNEHTPRILITCGHTICSDCLIDIINNPTLRKCPFDSLELNETPNSNSLDTFPINFALLALLEGKNKNICQNHNEKLSIICLKDRIKICSDCALFGEHKGHKIKKIKELKAQGTKAQKELEKGLVEFKKYQDEKAQEMEAQKQQFINEMGNKFEEIKGILNTRESEWTRQVENLFARDMDNHGGFFLKREAEKVLEEIDQACTNDINLAILNQDFSSIISRLAPQDANQEASKISEQTSKAMDRIAVFLVDQGKLFQNFDILNERIEQENPVTPKPNQNVKEEQEQLLVKEEHGGEKPSAKHIKEPEAEPDQERMVEEEPAEPERKSSVESQPQKPRSSIMKIKTLLSLDLQAESLEIRAYKHFRGDIMINLAAYSHVEKIHVELAQYSTLLAEPSDISFLSDIFYQLNNYTSLTVSFTPEGLLDHHVTCLLNLLFVRIENLTHIDICFDRCEITDEPIAFFFEKVLSKATSLQSLSLKFYCTPITNESLFALAGALALMNKSLESLTLGIGKTYVNDEGIQRIFSVLDGISALDLQLQRSLVSDQSLQILGESIMPKLANLSEFKLDGNEMKITLEGVKAIFEGIPNGIRVLKMRFEDVDLPEEVVDLLEEIVCPKLYLVEDVAVNLKGENLVAGVRRVLGEIRREAARRKRIREGMQNY